MNKNEYEKKDRRKLERLITDLPILFSVTEEKPEGSVLEIFEGRVINLSQEGLGIEARFSLGQDIFRKRQSITAELVLPDSPELLKVTGEAVWSTKIESPLSGITTLRFGIKISDISRQDRGRLRSYVGERLANSG